MKLFIILLIAVIIFALSVTIGANNDQVIIFNYLIAKVETKLSTLLACIFGIGFILSWLIAGLFYLRLRMRLTSAKYKIKKLQHQYDEQVTINNKVKLLSSSATESLEKL